MPILIIKIIIKVSRLYFSDSQFIHSVQIVLRHLLHLLLILEFRNAHHSAIPIHSLDVAQVLVSGIDGRLILLLVEYVHPVRHDIVVVAFLPREFLRQELDIPCYFYAMRIILVVIRVVFGRIRRLSLLPQRTNLLQILIIQLIQLRTHFNGALFCLICLFLIIFIRIFI